MNKLNPILLAMFMFIGFLQIGQAQHLLEYGKTKVVVKVISEYGGALYYQRWPDTTSQGFTRAILMSDVTSLKPIAYGDVDSVIAAINYSIVASEQAVTTEQSKEIRRFFIPAVATSFRSDQFNYNVSIAYGIQYHTIHLFGGGIGYDQVNKGKSFIVLNSAQVRLFYCRYLKRDLSKRRYYAGGEVTFSRAFSGKYNNAWGGDDIHEETEMVTDNFSISVGLKLLVGVNIKDRLMLDIGLLNRDLGIIYPDDDKRYFLGELRLAYRL